MEEKQMRRIVLVPAPFQGHISPMMQLGKTLHSRGFSITVAQTKFNSLNPSDHFLDFHFFTIPNSLSESECKSLGLIWFLIKLNDVCETSFENCLVQMLQQNDNIACVIYDEFMYFSEAAAKHLKLPSIIFSTGNATTLVSRSALGKHKTTGFLTPFQEPGSQDKPVPELHSLRFKDLPTSAFGSIDSTLLLFEKSSDKRTCSGIILNTASCLESSSLAQLHQEFQVPIYAVGPLHKLASTISASLLKEDRSCIEWLNKQKPNSVIYISLGSLAVMQNKEAVEMAWGLANSKQPFLWVIRPGSIPGSEWTESLPEEFIEKVSDSGYIVKWAPQKEVLAHWAVGGFWSHCGWNSTLESISEGVPMICRPFSGDQKVNTRYLSHVWRIGIQLEGEMEGGEIERAVRRLMEDEEGEEMRKRVMGLRDKVEASVRTGGSSHNSLNELVELIMSF